MGSFPNYLQHGTVFYVKCMGTCSQTAIANGEFGLSERLATASSDMSMQDTNRQYEWRYTQRKGTASQTGKFHGLMVQAYVAGSCTFQWLGCRSFFRERGVATAIGELPASCNSHWRFRQKK